MQRKFDKILANHFFKRQSGTKTWIRDRKT